MRKYEKPNINIKENAGRLNNVKNAGSFFVPISII